jgi:hypothetical protein
MKMSEEEESTSQIYRIRIQGNLDSRWSEWLANMSIAFEQTEAGGQAVVLTGSLADQAALRGVLNRLWDLNLAVISVNRIDRYREES